MRGTEIFIDSISAVPVLKQFLLIHLEKKP
jgi:hypothetical protein